MSPFWTFEAEFPHGKLTPQTVRIDSTPSYDEENATWSNFKTYHDDPDGEGMKSLYDVLGKYYTFSADRIDPQQWKTLIGTGTLKKHVLESTVMGIGRIDDSTEPRLSVVEQWALDGLVPEEVSFADLEHSTSELVRIEVKWRYESASKK